MPTKAEDFEDDFDGCEDRLLLKEYEKAQDSAEHHDYLLWVFFSILVTGLTVILGFSYGRDLLGKLVLSISGLLLIVAGVFFIRGFRYHKNMKYLRCRHLEKYFTRKYKKIKNTGMMQHNFVHETRKQYGKYALGGIEWIYIVLIVFTILFVFNFIPVF